MNMKQIIGTGMLVALAGGMGAWGAISALQPEGESDNPGKRYVEQMRQNAGGEEAMQAWMKAGQPGLPHEFMKNFEGEFDAVNRLWMDPSAPPMETAASCTNTMIMDGRYLKSDYEGSIMGQPFTGMGLMGFDNNKKLFTNMWIDSMSTGIATALGSFNQEGDTVTFVGAMDEPMTGEMGKSYKQVFRVTEGGYVMEMWEILYGDPLKVMEIEYTRK